MNIIQTLRTEAVRWITSLVWMGVSLWGIFVSPEPILIATYGMIFTFFLLLFICIFCPSRKEVKYENI